MNNTQRKLLDDILKLLNEANDKIEIVLMNEQNSLDNMPESLENSEMYISKEDAIESMEEANECIENAITNIELAKE